MNILILGPNAERIIDTVRAYDEDITMLSDELSIIPFWVDWVISYGYRHILRADVLAPLAGRCINLHISYLPWNRGAHPNYWSWVDETPKGVTIHEIDAGIDTGPILAQRLVELSSRDSFRGTHEKLMQAMDQLFAEMWPVIRTGRAPALPQRGEGSFHRSRDLPALRNGWDTVIADHLAENSSALPAPLLPPGDGVGLADS